jgi:hypothetical protein
MATNKYDEYWKRKEQEEKEASSSTQKTSSGKYDAFWARKFSEELPSLLEDYESSYITINTAYQNRFAKNRDTSKYRADTMSALTSYRNQKKDINSKSKYILDSLNTYKDYLNDDYVNQVKSYLDDSSKNLNGMYDAYKADNEYYSQWESENAYNSYVNNNKNILKYSQMSTEDLKKEKKAYDDSLARARMMSASNVASTPEEAFSKFVAGSVLDLLDKPNPYKAQETNLAEIEKKGILYYDGNGQPVTYDSLVRDRFHEQINEEINSDISKQSAYANALAASKEIESLTNRLQQISAEKTLRRAQLPTQISTEEQNIVNTINQQKAIIEDFNSLGYNFDEIKYYNQMKEDKEADVKRAEEAQKYAEEHAIKATFDSMFSAPMMMGEYAKNLIDTAKYGYANVYDDKYTNQSQIYQSTVSNIIDDAVTNTTNSKFAGWLASTAGWLASTAYSGVTSATQSAMIGVVGTVLSGGNVAVGTSAAMAIMGTQAAASSYNSAVRNGSTSGEAVAFSLASGIGEAVFEKLPLDNIFKLAKGAGKTATKEGIATLLKGLAKQSTVEGLEEGGTELWNTMADAIINGDHSAYNIAVDKYMAQGYSESDAKKMASTDWAKELITSMVGGFIGGGAAGGTVGTLSFAKNQGIQKAQYDALGKSTIQNQNVPDLVADAQSLVTEGEKNALNKLANKVAGVKNVDNLSKRQTKKYTRNVGKLVDEVANTKVKNIEAAQSEAIKHELESNGVEDVSQATDIVVKKMSGQSLTKAETEIFESVDGNTIINSVKNLDVKSADDKDNLKKTQNALKKTGELVFSKNKSVQHREMVEESGYTTTEGKTTVDATGVEVDSMIIDSLDGDDISLKVNTGENSEIVLAGELTLNDNYAVMLEGLKRIGKKFNLNTSSANNLLALYEAYNGDAFTFYKAMEAGISYGHYNIREYFDNNKFVADLPEAIREKLYEVGRENAQKTAEEKQAIVESKTTTKATGKVTFAEGVEYKKLNKSQKAQVDFAQVIAKALGFDLEIFQSPKENGVSVGESGSYSPNRNVMRLDIDAGTINGKSLILFTQGHELTHFIQKWSPAKYRVFADFLMENYAEKGVSVEALVNRKIEASKEAVAKEMQKLGDRYEQEKTRKVLTPTEAFDEVTADACEDFLADPNIQQKIIEIAKIDQSLAQKIKKFIKNLIARLEDALKGLQGQSAEAQFVRDLDAIQELKDLWMDALLEARENVLEARERTVEEQQAIEAFGEDLGSVETNRDGDVTLITNEDNSTLVYSEKTWLNGGKDALIKALVRNAHTEEEIKDVVTMVEDTLDYLKILAAGDAQMRGYKELADNLLADITTDIKGKKQVLHAIVNNGDYPVNIDLALICKKRVAYMNVMTRLIADGVMENVKYDGDAIAEVNAILRKNGFETACLGCFVESRRLQFQTWAETIVQEWNGEVDKRNKNAGSFNYTKSAFTDANSLTEEELNNLEKELSGKKKNKQGNLNLGQGSAITRMGKLLDSAPTLQKHISVADLLTPEGLTKLRAENPNLFSIVKSRYGAATPKIVQKYNPYASELANLTFKSVSDITTNAVSGSQEYLAEAKKELASSKPSLPKGMKASAFNKTKEMKDWNAKVETLAMRKYLYDIGGARMQSFSDFMIENVFDYIQIFADLAANKFPLHSYTKEIAFLRLFGMTGAKINGSLIAHVDKTFSKRYAGLLPAEEAKKGNAILVHTEDGDFAIGFDDYSRHVATKGTDGETFIQSIGMKDIIALQMDKRYSKNIGSITIGVSDVQILAMLDSPLFRMVIPYHSSGMLPQFAKLVGVDMYNDYTDYQNTTVKQYYDLNKNPLPDEVDDKGKTTLGTFKKADGKSIKANTSYSFNAELQKIGNPKTVADNYIAWCNEFHEVYDGKTLVGYAKFNPKFSNSPYGTDFTKHENYYKLLEDFNVYDGITEQYAAQGAVQMIFPSAETRLSAAEMEEYKQRLRDTGIFTEKEIEKYAKKADMTFEELLKAEVKNRIAYQDDQNPKWESTIKEIEDELKGKYSRVDKPFKAYAYEWTSDFQFQNRNYAEQVDEVLSGTFDRTNAVYVGATPPILADVGLNGELPMLTTARHLRNANKPKNEKKHHHGLTKNQLKMLPEKIANPVMIMDSLDKSSNSIVVVTDMLDSDNYPVVVVIKADGSGTYNSIVIDTNMLLAYYGRKNFSNFISNNVTDDTFLYINKEKSRKLSNSAKVQFFGKLNTYDFDTIIRKTRANVNIQNLQGDEQFQDRDSTGRELSPEQVEFFKDSKVRDENGNLKVVWHGTSAEFTVFDIEKAGSNWGGDSRLGKGFYFANTEDEAIEWSNSMNPIKAYLNLVNPLDITKEAPKNIAEEIDKYIEGKLSKYDESTFVITKEQYSKNLQKHKEMYLKNPSFFMDLFKYDDNGNMTDGVREFLTGLGYDGIIAEDETVAFFPNQIKSVDNLNPTESDDIRYQDREYLDLAQNPEANEARLREMVDEAAKKAGFNSPKLYHGTNAFGFTRIDTKRSNDRISFFATDSVQTAGTYSGTSGVHNISEANSSSLGMYQLYANTNEMMEFDAEGAESNHIALGLESRDFNYYLEGKSWHTHATTKQIARYAKQKGYRGVIIKNVIDTATPDSRKTAEAANIYIFFDPRNQVKSADLVTYDDSGNIIPLSERFNEGNEDIRYQDRPLSNREILVDALSNSDELSIEDKNRLEVYGQKIEKINEYEKELSDLGKKIHEIITTSGSDRTQLNALYTKSDKLRKKISRVDGELLNIEAMQPVKKLVEIRKKQILKSYKETVKEQRISERDRKNRTVMKNKIKGVVKELNSILSKGSKERNVKIPIQPAVMKALELAEYLFDDDLSNNFILTQANIEIREEEMADVEKYRYWNNIKEEHMKNMLSLMDKEGTESQVANLKDTISGVERKMGYLEKKLSSLITNEKKKLQQDGVGKAVKALAEAYSQLKNSEEDYVKEAYNEGVHTYIDDLANRLEGAKVKEMSESQMFDVYTAFKAVLTTVRDANKLFVNGKREDVQKMSSAIMMQISANKKTKTVPYEKLDTLKSKMLQYSWNELKPYYAFQRLGSSTLMKLYEAARQGEDVLGRDYQEAITFAERVKQKYGYDSWDMNKRYDIKLKDGREFTITLQEIMSIYAYSKREQAYDHMMFGGFVFNDKKFFKANEGAIKGALKPKTYRATDAEAYRLSLEDLAEIDKIINNVKGLKGFVDEMQGYLSTDMAAKGNEVSRVLYGVDWFKEKNYFPIKSSRDFLAIVNNPSENYSLRNSGMTKTTVPHAKNPLVLEDFMTVWAEHVGKMSTYHSLVIPIDNLNKVLGYKEASTSMKTVLDSVFGKSAKEYLDNFLKDLNGGVSSQGAKSPVASMFGKFKKTAVAASTSVVVQQPTAILRAMAEIDGKYFVGASDKLKHNEKWELIKKYAPVAVIKELGGFDIGSGRRLETILTMPSYEGKDKVKGFFTDSTYRNESLDNAFMWGASKADEIGWNIIWSAVEREVKATSNLKYGTEEFYQKVGERFTEVVHKTQVYDSTFTRSGFQRSKSDLVQMSMSFMGEPTTSFNMLYDAVLQSSRNKISKGKATRIIGATVASIIMASVMKSFIYALRDDDEDESYLEKYMESTTENLVSDLFIPNMLPFVKDITSILSGWNVERTDFAIFTDIYESVNQLSSDTVSGYRKVEDLIGSIASLFGVPAKNLLRTGREIYNVAKNIFDNNVPYAQGVADAVKRGLPFTKEKSKSDKLYEAKTEGQQQVIDRYEGENIDNSLKKGLRDNDKRILKGVDALLDSDYTKYGSIINQIASEGKFSKEVISDAIQSETNYFNNRIEKGALALRDGDKKTHNEIVRELRDRYRGIYSQDEIVKMIKNYVFEEKEESDDEESIFKTRYIKEALEKGDTYAAQEMIEDIVSVKMANGKTEKEAKQSVRSSLTSYWKPLYEQAFADDDSYEQNNIRDSLYDMGVYGDYEDIDETLHDWKQSYVLDTYKPQYIQAYQNGDTSEMRRIESKVNSLGVYKDAYKTVRGWIE